jgi:nitrogen fixation protein NifU and related proteins
MTELASDMQQLYRDVILDHSRSPRHFGRMTDATHVADGINPLCGDRLRLYLRVQDDGTISASSFEGSGCAISVASASLLTEAVNGVSTATASRWFVEVTSRLDAADTDEPMSHGLETLTALDGVRDFPGRVKCATLAWHALSAALNNEAEPASTE